MKLLWKFFWALVRRKVEPVLIRGYGKSVYCLVIARDADVDFNKLDEFREWCWKEMGAKIEIITVNYVEGIKFL